MAESCHRLDEQHDDVAFWGHQTVFLTGATGGLGGCLLYKLVVVLKVPKIYVLCRDTSARAIATWNKNMPYETPGLLASKRIAFVVGDMTALKFGIDPIIQAELAKEVTVLVHAAANISLGAPLSDIVTENCLPVLELAKMSTVFQDLKVFIQISSAYANSHLEDGPVEEKIYPLEDAEEELKRVLATGSTEHLPQFAWPYAYSKHLMERLLMSRYPNLPILIVRPTIICPAIYQPHPFYGPDGSCPMETLFSLYMRYPNNGIWHAAQGQDSATNILDEIPVDWVANIILLHGAAGTTGIIHASAASYVLRTFDQMLQQAHGNVPDKIRTLLPPFNFVRDRSIDQCPVAEMYQVATRDWQFSIEASKHLLAKKGPLSIAVGDHDVAKWTGERFVRFVRKMKLRRKPKPKSRICKL